MKFVIYALCQTGNALTIYLSIFCNYYYIMKNQGNSCFVSKYYGSGVNNIYMIDIQKYIKTKYKGGYFNTMLYELSGFYTLLDMTYVRKAICAHKVWGIYYYCYYTICR